MQPLKLPSRTWLAAAALVVALPAWAQGANRAGIDAAYQRDRAACTSLMAEQRTNCLRDAAAARQQALRTGRTPASQADLERNALQRCQAHTPENRAICERMARGEGTTSGSVEGGGQIRQLVTQETLPAPAPQPMPMPQPTPQTMPPTMPPPVQAVPPMQPPPVQPPTQPMPPVQSVPPMQPAPMR